jgi:hypothetical protein
MAATTNSISFGDPLNAFSMQEQSWQHRLFAHYHAKGSSR